MTPEQIDDDSTGECPCGCGEAAYPFAVDGIEGYFDAAPACADALALDFIEENKE